MSKLLEKAMTHYSSGLYNSKSPIDRNYEEPEYGEYEDDNEEEVLDDVSERIEPMCKAREVVNKLHSEGYFENYYPKADKLLKSLAHNRVVMAANRMAKMGRLKRKATEATAKMPKFTISIQLGSDD